MIDLYRYKEKGFWIGVRECREGKPGSVKILPKGTLRAIYCDSTTYTTLLCGLEGLIMTLGQTPVEVPRKKSMTSLDRVRNLVMLFLPPREISYYDKIYNSSPANH